MITRRVSYSRTKANCPRCGSEWKKHSTCSRTLREIGLGEAVEIIATYTKHFCRKCHKHFCVQVPEAAAGSRYTNRVKELAMSLVRKNGMTLAAACATLLKQYHVNLRPTTLHDWLANDREPQPETAEEKTDAQETPSAAGPSGGGDGPPPQEPQAPSGG